MSFLNSVLIEECRECQTPNLSSLNTSNVQTSTKVLKDNLQYLIENAMNDDSTLCLSLTGWLLACPIFYAFLSKDICDKIKEVLHVDAENDFFINHSIIDTIDKIGVKR